MSSPYDPPAPGEPPAGYGQPPVPEYGHPAGEHSAEHDPAGHYSAGPYSAGGYPAGHYPAGDYPAGDHSAGGYSAGGYSAGGYVADGYPAGGYPAGWYPPAGYQQWPAVSPTRPPRPAALVVAGVLWLVEGALLLVLGTLTAIADRLPGFEEAMLESGETITREQLLTVGISGVGFGAVIAGLGVAVLLTGATWARALVVVFAAVPSLLLVVLVLPPVLTIAATVLQFLPPVNRWVQRPAGSAAGA